MNSNERYGLIKVVDQYGKYGFKDLNGETLIPCQYDEAWVRLSRHIEVELNGKHGFVDRVGKILTPIKYDSLGKILGIDSAVLHPWIYIGRVKNKCVFLDCRTGSELTPYYDRIWYGLACLADVFKDFSKENLKNRIVRDNKQYLNSPFISVCLNGKWGYINAAGEEVFPPKFAEPEVFFGLNIKTALVCPYDCNVRLYINEYGGTEFAKYEFQKYINELDSNGETKLELDEQGKLNYNQARKNLRQHFGDEVYAKSILELSSENDMDNYCILIFDNCENVQIADEICKNANVTKITNRTHRCNAETCELFKNKTCNGINEKLNYGIFPMWR